MKIEKLRIRNFRCFGHKAAELDLEEVLTTLVGGNGSGKTAVLLALSRLFGTSKAQRSVQRRDFHIPNGQQPLQSGDQLFIEAVFVFPELKIGDESSCNSVPEFFKHMSASGEGQPLKARMRLQATWIDDGTPEGSIEEELRWINSLDENYTWDECVRVQPIERAAIQFIYLPANRDAITQVTALLKGRLWTSAKWSQKFKNDAYEHSDLIRKSFEQEEPSSFLLGLLTKRWRQVHSADTDRTPRLQLLDSHLEELVRNAEFTFAPDEAGQEHRLSELSDGQRSLFHIALTAATLEAERHIFELSPENSFFEQDKLHRVHLTILAVEEPENSLSPFFLSRIAKMAREIGSFPSAQVLLTSHSPAILSRIEPEEVRYLRLDPTTRCSSILDLNLPEDGTEANAYVRLAVKAYPELYFARFVILGEGDSERLVIPKIAEEMGIPLDPSFVPVVPLGGRFVTHFWKLLDHLGIPYATLLDLDLGRRHGGVKVLKSCFNNLSELQKKLWETSQDVRTEITLDDINQLTNQKLLEEAGQNKYIQAFQKEGIFFSYPLDLDFAMLRAFPSEYQTLNPRGSGPQKNATDLENKKKITLKKCRDETMYDQSYDETFIWYPYLFLNRSKPETHMSALSRISHTNLLEKSPAEIKALIEYVKDKLDF